MFDIVFDTLIDALDLPFDTARDHLGMVGLSAPLVWNGLAAGLSVLAYLPYMRDTLRGVTRPHRASWFIWSVLATISFFSLLYEEAGGAVWFAGTQAGCTLIIFVLSLAHGQGRWITRADGLVLCLASLGLVVWAVTDSAAYALAISITVSLLGGTLTLRKAYRAPETETLGTWLLCWLAAGAALAGLTGRDPIAAAYPLYLFVLNGAIVLAIGAGRTGFRGEMVRGLAGGLAGGNAAREVGFPGAAPRLPQPLRVPSKGLVPRQTAPFAPPRRVKNGPWRAA